MRPQTRLEAYMSHALMLLGMLLLATLLGTGPLRGQPPATLAAVETPAPAARISLTPASTSITVLTATPTPTEAWPERIALAPAREAKAPPTTPTAAPAAPTAAARDAVVAYGSLSVGQNPIPDASGETIAAANEGDGPAPVEGAPSGPGSLAHTPLSPDTSALPPAEQPAPAQKDPEPAPAPGPEQEPEPTPPPAPRYRVGIQAGHWKNSELPAELSALKGSTGASGKGWTEVATNLDIAKRVAAILEAQNIQVDLIPATVPVSYQADAFVAIHADANANTNLTGWKAARAKASKIPNQDDALVEALQTAYRAATGLPEHPNTITTNMTSYYAFNNRLFKHAVAPTTPSVIFETVFMTTPGDRKLITEKPDVVAGGIANGILKFLGEQ